MCVHIHTLFTICFSTHLSFIYDLWHIDNSFCAPRLSYMYYLCHRLLSAQPNINTKKKTSELPEYRTKRKKLHQDAQQTRLTGHPGAAGMMSGMHRSIKGNKQTGNHTAQKFQSFSDFLLCKNV